MKKITWIWIVTIALGFGVILLLLKPRETPKASDQSILHDILRLQQMEISSFDPLDAYHAGHIQIVKQLYNTLVDIDLNGKSIPSLAETWETHDGKTWRFYLREDVFFTEAACFEKMSDRHLVASDVRYTFERLLNKNSTSLGVSYFTNIVGMSKYRNGDANGIKGIEIVDDHTVVFHLAEQDYSFPALLTLPYVSIVKKIAIEFHGENFKLDPVGTGPFVLKEYEPEENITLVKNQGYWEKQDKNHLPFVDMVVIHLTTDDNRALLMFRSKRADFLELSFPMLKQIETMEIPFDYETQTQENPQLNFYLFNLYTMKDASTRKAINYALNRNMIQKILAKQGNVVRSLYPPSIFRELFSTNDILTYKPGDVASHLSDIKKIRLVSFEDILSKSISNFIASELEKYDIEVEIESVPFPVLVDRLNEEEYDLIQIYWGPLYADACHYLNPFLTSSFPPTGNNFNKYSNPEFDALVQEAKSLPGNRRKERFLEAETVILNDMPFLLLYFKNTIRVSNRRFEMPLHPLQYRFYKYAKRLK